MWKCLVTTLNLLGCGLIYLIRGNLFLLLVLLTLWACLASLPLDLLKNLSVKKKKKGKKLLQVALPSSFFLKQKTIVE